MDSSGTVGAAVGAKVGVESVITTARGDVGADMQLMVVPAPVVMWTQRWRYKWRQLWDQFHLHVQQ